MQVDDIVVSEFSTPLFLVKYDAGEYTLSWHQSLLEMLQSPRYKAYFCAIDLARTNAETSVRALCHKSDTQIAVIANVIAQSISKETWDNHIIGQCFFELGLL